jgi:hypothetical protein
MSERSDVRTWSFLCLLIGGILILVGGLMGAFMMGTWGWTGMMSMSGMMDAYTGTGWSTTMAWWMGIIGFASGSLVITSAYQVYRQQETVRWGVIAIVAGALSLFAMGGYVIGAIAAIAGGALALIDKQQESPRAGGA